MARGNPIFFGGAAILVCALAFAADHATSELVFHPLDTSSVQVNAESQADARLYETKEWGLYILDLPSEAKEILLDARSGKAILLMRSEVQRGTNKKHEETLRVDPRTPLGESSYALTKEGDSVAFKTDISEVRVQLPPRERKESATAANGKPEAAAAPTAAPAPAPSGGSGAPSTSETAPAATPSAEARACVRLETRPTPGIPGCSKSIYLKNTCDQPVAATMRRTEHLMTGTVPEEFSAVVPGGTEEWIGCSWWSGAMAPAQHDIVAAGFLGHRHH